jgi:hypothetical protein
MLKKAELLMDDVMAEALAKKIDTFERIDRMLSSSERRRNDALREIDRHRSALGAVVRQAIDEGEDALAHFWAKSGPAKDASSRLRCGSEILRSRPSAWQ